MYSPNGSGRKLYQAAETSSLATSALERCAHISLDHRYTTISGRLHAESLPPGYRVTARDYEGHLVELTPLMTDAIGFGIQRPEYIPSHCLFFDGILRRYGRRRAFQDETARGSERSARQAYR
jgi:hypothetical protein